MIIYKSRFLTRGEVWFDEEPDRTKTDSLLYHQWPQAVPGARWRHFHTFVIDLRASPEQLLAQLSKDTAYRIRRARDKDKVACEWYEPVDAAVLGAFEEMYNRFVALKGLRPLNRSRFDSMATAGVLGISVAKDACGRPLVYHVNLINRQPNCAIFSASPHLELADSGARNAIGRANRLLFWSEILRSRERGLKYFDFCGWYPGQSDQTLLRINHFKKGFGGEVVREYECEQILTARGWVVLSAARFLKRCRRLAVREYASADSDSPPDSEVPDQSSSALGLGSAVLPKT